MPPLFITEAHQKTVKKESILFVGRDDNHKGFRLFVEVSKIFPDEAFIAVTQPKKITKFPKNLEIRSNISERELNDLYNRSKIFIFPSNYESFGGVFIEALSRGVIVIASNMILGTEFFEDNENIHKFKVTKDKQKCINAISERVKYIISNGVTFNDYANLHEQKNAISKKMHEQNYFSLLEVHQ